MASITLYMICLFCFFFCSRLAISVNDDTTSFDELGTSSHILAILLVEVINITIMLLFRPNSVQITIFEKKKKPYHRCFQSTCTCTVQ